MVSSYNFLQKQRMMQMNKAKWNYIIDMLIFAAFIIVFATGIFKFPALRLHRLGIFDMGLITFIHDWSGVAMGVLAFIHIILHWDFISCMTKAMFKRKE